MASLKPRKLRDSTMTFGGGGGGVGAAPALRMLREWCVAKAGGVGGTFGPFEKGIGGGIAPEFFLNGGGTALEMFLILAFGEGTGSNSGGPLSRFSL